LSCTNVDSPITKDTGERDKESDRKTEKITHRHRSKSGTVPSAYLPSRLQQQQKIQQPQLTESSPIPLVVHPPSQTVGTLTPHNSCNYHTVGRKVQKFYAINDYDEFVLAVDKKRVRGYSVGKQDDQELPLELFFNESSTLSEPMPPVVSNVDALDHGFKVENECELFNPKTYKLDIQREVYKEQYSDSKHLIWVGSFPKSEEYFIVTLLDMPTQRENLYQALEHSKKGIQEFEIVCIKKRESKNNTKIFEKALEQHFLSASFYPLKTTSEIVHDMIQIEAKHKLVVTRLEIAVIYAKAGQKNPLDMFLNEGSPEYEKFQKILTSRQKWHGLEVIWHVATQMNEEQHRRCIGNCQCIVFFKDSHILFSVDQIGNLGVVPQFFVVVEPFQDRYRLGFFQRTILHPFGPQLPANYIFNVHSLIDFIFTKVHNGYMAAMRCPGPISRLHEQPLSFAIKEVVEKYCPKTWLNKQQKH